MRPFVKLATIALAMTVFAAAPAAALEAKPYDAESFKAAQGAGKPILIDVYASWCPTCRAQQQVLETLKSKPEYAGITLFKVDFDGQKDALRAFGAQRQSTLIAFKGGKETGRSVADTSADKIETLLKSTLQ